MRALEPVASGFAVNPVDGVRIFYETFGRQGADRTVVFSPAGCFAHSRLWKLQVPYFALHEFRVVSYDCRGSGKSAGPDNGYTPALHQTEPLDEAEARRLIQPFLAEPEPGDPVHWCKADMRDRYPELALAIATEDFCEPHSTKGVEDLTRWALETDPAHLIASCIDLTVKDPNDYFEKIRCPTLLIHGELDPAVPLATARRVHRAIPHSQLVILEGSGHVPVARDPVRTNHMIHEFLDHELLNHEAPRERTWRRARSRQNKRALFVSSPIGLGHSQRDVAIAKQLRELVPGLEIDWLAQHPVTTVLTANDERIHPASAKLAGESPHIEAEMGAEHELNVFQAIRDMDEILLANFHVFHDVAKEGNYDLWVGDEAWEVDYYLHENPELKTAPFAWLTDFVGYLPMVTDDGGREAYLTADYNAEMIEQVERFKRIRDASIYIGEPGDLVPDDFGPGLPVIADWVSEQFDFNGYIRYFDPATLGGRAERRAPFGFGDDERVVVAAVGGTSVGTSLLRRIVASYPQVAAAVPGLRLIVVCGPASTRLPCSNYPASSTEVTSTTSTSCWPRPTRHWCKAGCRPPWSWWRPARRSSTSR